jgi:transcriptional regulator GlxA family with amidase domain
MPDVVFILSEHMLATSTTWPSDMLSAANYAAKRLCPQKPLLNLTIAAETLSAITCHSGVTLTPQQSFEDIERADIIYLPALWRNPQPIIKRQTKLIAWLQKQFEQGAIISAVGTGCCFIAETGLLDNKPATTHWYYFDKFQQLYPAVELKRQHFITQAGSIYCAASINSLADLSVYFIQRFFNTAVAQHIQRHFSHEIRKPYESLSYFENNNVNHPDETMLQAQLWMLNNSAKASTLDNIAQQFDMSPRNFSRRFKLAIGKTPIKYLHEMRLNNAKELLQSSNLSIAEIAYKVGYNDMSYFAKLFKKELYVSPKVYRKTVRAKLFTTGNTAHLKPHH